MSQLTIPLLCGLGFGGFAVLTMLPLSFADRKTALAGAFASRFAIGFLAPCVSLPWPAAVSGAAVGLLISLPDAILTKAYAPVVGLGLVGGGLIGWLASLL